MTVTADQAAQLDHIVESAARPFTFVQVAPFSLGERRPSHMPLTLLTLADRTSSRRRSDAGPSGCGARVSRGSPGGRDVPTRGA
ncbi:MULTISPECIES: Scr1 family TA system antitoxin-like transcriptional regulator [Streptomyces]|uniref:Scr1 family TA system antitoxin-like transcriptional regulator n=1 Tax=Streptomyces TaxID=1883 RepID=UPI00227709FF|nr:MULTISPECIES: Scr1 family TA system antitoxin-like transcriptional regulator [Streptomyces]